MNVKSPFHRGWVCTNAADRMLSPRATAPDSLACYEVHHRLCEWIRTIGEMERLTTLNATLEEASAGLLSSLPLTPEAQQKAAFTYEREIGRLSYAVWLPGAASAVTEPSALRAALRQTSRALLWRMANQSLFAMLAETLFGMVAADWPDGELSLSNVKGAGGEGGHFELWLPPSADEASVGTCSFSSEATAGAESLGEAAEPIDGGLLVARCTFRAVVQEQSGEELELARFGCVCVVDLDQRRHCQHVASCTVPPELLDLSLASPRLLSASHELGIRQQHLAQPQKSGWVVKRGRWLPIWRRRWAVLHHGCLHYWSGVPPFHPREWSEDELNSPTSNDVIQLAGASMTCPTAAVVDDEQHGGRQAEQQTQGGELEEQTHKRHGGVFFEITLETPCSRHPRYLLRLESAEERDEWASAIAQHLWRGPSAAA